MAKTNPAVEETAEAMIISGVRKGEVIRLPGGEPNLSAAEAALLDTLTESTNRLAESARAAAAEAEALLHDLRRARER